MALVSPGLEVTVTDESQYVSTSTGTVPFILFATAQDKVFNGATAPLTTKENAGKLLAVTSQRDLITNFGYPVFKQSTAGSPLHGDPLNEYGLMTAYSALGVCNRAYLIRADIDLSQLEGTEARPIGDPANGTYWLDTAETEWGVYEWDAATQGFVKVVPLLITSTDEIVNNGGVLTPVDSVGSVGEYAIVATSLSATTAYNNSLFVKINSVWQQVGSLDWQNAIPTTTGGLASITTPGDIITINGVDVTIGTDAATAVININSAVIPGVTAEQVGSTSSINLYVTNEAMSDGVTVDGSLSLISKVGNVGDAVAQLGFGASPKFFNAPSVAFGSFAQVPNWRSTDSDSAPTGSVWIKTSAVGGGANIVVNKYDAQSDLWITEGTPLYENETIALARMDPAAGGNGITAGTLYVRYNKLEDGTVTYDVRSRTKQGATVVKGTATSPTFVNGNSFTVHVSVPGQEVLSEFTVTLGGTAATAFAAAILAANIPNVTSKVETDGSVSVTHKQGGILIFEDISGGGTPLATAGFTTAAGLQEVPAILGSVDALMASNFTSLLYTASDSAPYTEPADGTLWFYNSPLEVDIMINETTGWKGYQNVSSDARGYNLVNTDPNGPIMAPVAPTTQSDETALEAGDLWVDTGDLQNFPVISRWNGTAWVKIDNSDRVTQNGIVFADARWDADGTTDTAAGALTSIKTLLTVDEVDIDAPDYRLYPRGTLLFNLRRSGFNVKRYVKNYFNDNAFPDDTLPAVKSTWVTASGLKNDGSPYMGSAAQRTMVVKAMRSALDLSDSVREDSFQFNLLVAPGFPELISNLVQLNTDRKETGFIIGDTPMDLKANVIDLTNWSTNATGEGLSTASPYLGVFYPSGLANDLQGNTIMVPPSHMALRSAIKSDSVSYPWFSFAGTRRGLIDNATDIGYLDADSGAFIRNGLKQGLRDALYPLNINPITLLPGVGLTNFGNKTRLGVASSLDRINVARLVNYLRTIFARVGDGFLFEPNDAITRNQIKQIIESALNDLIAKRGIYDYVVVCDETNNDPGRIARNELYVDIAIEPMKDVEFIYIPIRLKNPGDIAAGV